MKWLVWKEYRLNRLILIVGAVLLVVPHAITLLLAWYGVGPSDPDRAGLGLSRLSMNLLSSGLYSLVLSQFTLCLLGGHLIACERADRSAEFLAYLPVSRARILAGKIILVLVTVALIWGANLLVMWLATLGLPGVATAKFHRMGWHVLPGVAIMGFLSFSVGWLLSSMLESPTFAICGGLISPFVLMMGVSASAWLFGFPGETARLWYLGTWLALASACFVTGTWYYLRRVAP